MISISHKEQVLREPLLGNIGGIKILECTIVKDVLKGFLCLIINMTMNLDIQHFGTI